MVFELNLTEKTDESFKLSEEVIFDLKRQESKVGFHTGSDIESPLFLEDEEVLLVTKDLFATVEDNKITESTLIWTTKRSILYGTEVKGTLVASIVSREFEGRRGILEKHRTVEPLRTKGWNIPHAIVTSLEIVKLGNYYSLFFFDDEKRIYLMNDLNQKEADIIEKFMIKQQVEITRDEFKIPLIDIILFCVGGFFLMLLGWIFIAIIF
ncbi:MAG: hypothetical protein ACFFAE_12555 [Candidatus Hodarchaeota archaeon]